MSSILPGSTTKTLSARNAAAMIAFELLLSFALAIFVLWLMSTLRGVIPLLVLKVRGAPTAALAATGVGAATAAGVAFNFVGMTKIFMCF
ncbi:MAG TPA: hypothetical protein VGD36_08780, partial [Xanthobacteraceae bacterium]